MLNAATHLRCHCLRCLYRAHAPLRIVERLILLACLFIAGMLVGARFLAGVVA